MESYSALLDIIGVIVGVYIFYLGFKAKSGNVDKALIWRSDVPFTRCRDKEGFIKFVCIRCYIAGILLVIFGLLSTVNSMNMVKIPYVDLIDMVICLFVLVWYCIFCSKAKKNYFD